MSPGDAALDRAVSEAISALAFSDAMPVDDPLDRALDAVTVPLVAPYHGTLRLRITPSDLRSLGQLAWGNLADASDAQDEAFLFELANIVAGQLLANLFPGVPVSVELPRREDAAALAELRVVRAYDLDGVRLWVELGSRRAPAPHRS